MKKAETGFSPQALAPLLADHLRGRPALKVAYSGGVDSHVLLHALVQLRATARWPVSALHIDHGLHPASAAWACHCLQICRALNVPCIVERVEVVDRQGEGQEAAARRARYAQLAHHIAPRDVLLTAHQLDDQAETLLLQLLRGTGVRGIAAMPVIAPFAAGLLMRPLLGFRRAELVNYARTNGLQWIEDSSNREMRYARNFVRHEALPLLERRWPQAMRQLARAATHAREAAALIDSLARQDLVTVVRAPRQALSIQALQRLTPVRQRNLLRYWIESRGFDLPSTQSLQRICRLLAQSSRSNQAAVNWPGAQIRRYRDTLVILPLAAPPLPDLRIAWDPAGPLELPGTDLLLRLVPAVGKGLAHERVHAAPLSIRFRRGGERCQLPGHQHHHKLKKLLQAAGVPPWERERLPLVYVGEELAAVADRWVCAPFAANAGEPGLEVVLEHRENVA